MAGRRVVDVGAGRRSASLVALFSPRTWRGWRIPPSAAVLVVANLLPILGGLLLGWTVFAVMLLYWLENLVVGLHGILRIAAMRPKDNRELLLRFVGPPFFAVHFGMFTYVHGVIVFAVFGGQDVLEGGIRVAPFVAAVRDAGIGWAGLALFCSHGASFVLNYLGKGEYRQADIDQLMRQPYVRLAGLHVLLILSGFFVMFLPAAMVGVVLLVILKTVLDLYGHLWEHGALPETR